MTYVPKWRVEFRGHKTRWYYSPETAFDTFRRMLRRDGAPIPPFFIRDIGDNDPVPDDHATLRRRNIREAL